MALLPKVKLKALVSFPSTVAGGNGITVEKENGNYTVDLDYSDFAPPVGVLSDTGNLTALLWNVIQNRYVLSPISLLGGSGGGSSIGFAAPSAQVGLTPVAGTSTTTAMRSDAAPVLSQAITPTWTNPHTFTKAAVFSGDSNVAGPAAFQAGNVFAFTGGSSGFNWNNQASSATLMRLNNSGALQLSTYRSGQVQVDVSGNVIHVPGVINIATYGGVGDNATLNDAAWVAACNALSATGTGCIYFPAGVYKFSAAINLTITALTGSVTICGDGPQATELHFTGASDGIVLTQGDYRSNCYLHDFSVTTSSQNVGIAIHLQSTFIAVPTSPWNFISNIHISGDDHASYGYVNCWNTGIRCDLWSQINFINVNVFGKYLATPGAAMGIGVYFAGSAASSSYGILYNFSQCSFNFLLYGAIYGDWIQGVTFRACNFNGRTGGTGILIGGSYTGIPAQLEISGCQFDFGGSSLAIYSNVYDLILHGNLMAAAVNSTPICQVFATSFSIIGNSFYVFDSATSCQGIKVAGGGIGAIGFNRFKDVQVGAAADAGTTAVTVGMNTFANVSTKVINSGGAANAFSLQAYGTMSGVVP